MLELKNIKKDYLLKDQEPVHALKGISLRFRANEFVAILGPSGCGKTTLLNVIGGLDHYDSGDLIIKNRSTKDYKDADWDTYRNHSIGFVFQTYNLIPHQTILKNVELALTISGVEKDERIQRAKVALDKVGLKGLYNKKPNQMSGGQMQRVAIARALVNNPEIVLADEPTGALDSETSVQIMDLLHEVAKDHLVIMVTHNPELAEKYASRIVKMKDGEILDDSNVYNEKLKEEVLPLKEESKGKKKQSSMSFFTALKLSLSNLLSKFKRTALVAIAGSIGIIGVSTILAVSVGVNAFINDMQNDMLSSYPISVQEETVDLTSLLSGLSNSEKKDMMQFDYKTEIGMDSMIQYLMERYADMTTTKTNDLTKDLVDYIDDMPSSYYASIFKDYGIDPTNNFFTAFKEDVDSESSDIISLNGLTQRYFSTLQHVEGFESYSQFLTLFTSFMNELPGDKDYILSQYGFVGENSRFPQNENEILLVVDDNQTLTDLTLAQMGFFTQDKFIDLAMKAQKSEEAYKKYLEDHDKEAYEKTLKDLDEIYGVSEPFNIQEILDHEMYYFPHDSIYETDPDFVSHNTCSASIVARGKYLGFTDVLNIITLNYNNESDSLTGSMLVLKDGTYERLVDLTILLNRDPSTPRNKEKSVFDGKWTYTVDSSVYSALPEGSSLTLNFTFASTPKTTSESQLTFDLTATGNAKMNGFITLFELTDTISAEATERIPSTKDYYYHAYLRDHAHPEHDKIDYINHPEDHGGVKIKIAGILKAKDGVRFGSLSRGVYYTREFANKYRTMAANSEIVTEFKKHIEEYKDPLLSADISSFRAYVSYYYDDMSAGTSKEERVSTFSYAGALNSSRGESIGNIFASFLGRDNSMNNDASHLRALAGLKFVTEEQKEESPTKQYDVVDQPVEISIYPKDFKTKDYVKNYLKRWNSDKDLTLSAKYDHRPIPASTRDEITITDTISIIVTTISTFVNVVSIALIAFTSLSLVVSCFMIAVITYISVMERVKEIGVIRSLGGRKKDVSRLFIAENIVTGLASGVFGIAITYLLQLIINLIATPFGVSNIAALPFYLALAMIGLSVLLSVVSGLIPSFSASKQDPVVALRSE